MDKLDASSISSILRQENGRLFWVSGRNAGLEAGCKMKSDGRVRVRIGGRSGPLVFRYRLIWAIAYGHWPTGEVDHIDGDCTNDRLSNLRIATSSQNKRNIGVSSANKSGYKGVFRIEKLGKWAAQIRINKKSTHIGVYETPELAHAAYCRANAVVSGSFANNG